MRVKPLVEINTNQHPNQNRNQNAVSPENGKSAAMLSFEEHLSMQVQDMEMSTAIRKAEMMADALNWGLNMPIRVTNAIQIDPDDQD